MKALQIIVFACIMAVLAASANADSGIRGEVLRHKPLPPGVGACTLLLELNSPCYDLVQLRLAFYQGSKIVRDVRTNFLGQYRVNLRPGTYSIRRSPRDTGYGVIKGGENIRVRRGVFTLAQLSIVP